MDFPEAESGWIAISVILDAVEFLDRAVVVKIRVFGDDLTAYLFSFVKHDVDFGGAVDLRIADNADEDFTVAGLGDPGDLEFFGQVDLFGPVAEAHFTALHCIPEGLFLRLVFGRFGRKELKTRAGADGVFGEGLDDAVGIAVVGAFIAGAGNDDVPDSRGERGVGAEGVGVLPVPHGLGAAAGGVKSAADCVMFFRFRHFSGPWVEILAIFKAEKGFFAAFFRARN